MALFRKFFHRKPHEGLSEISEKIYVFNCCFSSDVLGTDEYGDYVGGVVAQLHDYFPDASLLVFNFRDGKNHSQIANILSEYEITVMDYPRQYDNCPLVTMDMIHHFLKSSENWLAGHRNMLLLHCEHGEWPVLAFVLAALLIYSKQYTGEQRTLDMIYEQAPRELLQLMLSLNPLPSQYRYLYYVSSRKLGSEWPRSDRALTLDCIRLRVIPTMGGESGFRPIFRIYGPDPRIEVDPTPMVHFSSSEKIEAVRDNNQADSEMVKIEISRHIQGDVVLECITLDHDLQLEEIIFRITFNTAFIRSNILDLGRDEIDTPWNAHDNIPGDFRVEVLFSEMDSSSSVIRHDHHTTEDKESLPSEAFSGMFRNVEWPQQKDEVEKHHAGKENMCQRCSQNSKIGKESCCHEAAKEENPGIYTLPSNANKNLGSVHADAFEVEERFSRVNLINPKTDVALNTLQITASNTLHGEQETSICAGKGRLDARSQSVSVEILERISPESAKEDTLETAFLWNDGGENWASIGPNDVVEGMVTGKRSSDSISEIPNSEALGSGMRSFQPESLEAKCVESCTSLDTNLLTKKTQELQNAIGGAVQSKIFSPRNFHSPLSNPASNSLQGSPSSFTRFSNASSVVGITALLHDTSVNKRVGSHVVTISPRSSLSASFPQLCKPVTPDISQVVKPSELPSTPVTAINLGKVSATTVRSSPLPSIFLKAPPSELAISASNELDFPQKSDSEIPTLGTGCSPSVTHPSALSSAHPGILQPSSTSNAFTPLHPPPPLLSRTAASLSQTNLFTSHPFPPSTPSSSFSASLVTQENIINTSPIAPLPEIALSSGVVPPLLNEKSTKNDSSSMTPSPPNLLLSSDSSITATTSASPPPLPPPPPTASSSCHTTSFTTKYSSFASMPLTSPLPGSNSSSGLISLIVPENKLEITAFPPLFLHSGFLSSAAVTSAEQPVAPQSPAPPSHALKEAPSPTGNSSSIPPLSQPAFPKAGSFSGSICSLVSQPPEPPPPPLQSKAFTNPATLAPPPPPPPSFPPKEPMSKRISSHIPPPPAPFSNGLPKFGASFQSASSVRGGNIPPTSAPSMIPKGRLQSSSTNKPQSQTKKISLKPYHWLKLTRAVQGSLWAEAQTPEEASKTPEFDMSELERLFSAINLSSDHGSMKEKSRRTSRSKSEKVNLIDLRRAYNCEIMLTKVKIPLPELMSSVLTLDDSALDVDQVDNLIKFCPTKDETELLKNFNGNKENLGKCEQFFLELMKVPRVESKLRVFSFKIQFSSQVSDLRNALNTVSSASEEVRKSVKLKRIMQAILSLGNALNHGTARGSAVGFRLDSLLKLTDTRARNKKMTLMHYLCKVLAEKLPELLDFPKDLISLEAANKIQLKYLAEEMQAISKGLEKVGQELTVSENDGLVSESFCKTLKEFLFSAEAEVRSLASLYSAVGKDADALAYYFGEDPARCPFEQVISTLLNFVRMFVRAHEENCKESEFERKRAQKSGKNETANLGASSMQMRLC